MSVATLIDIIIVICAVECVVLYAIHHSLAPLWGLALTVFHSKAAGRLWATERKQIEQVAERRVSQMVNESTNGGAPAPDSLIGSLTQQAGAAAETALQNDAPAITQEVAQAVDGAIAWPIKVSVNVPIIGKIPISITEAQAQGIIMDIAEATPKMALSLLKDAIAEIEKQL